MWYWLSLSGGHSQVKNRCVLVLLSYGVSYCYAILLPTHLFVFIFHILLRLRGYKGAPSHWPFTTIKTTFVWEEERELHEGGVMGV